MPLPRRPPLEDTGLFGGGIWRDRERASEVGCGRGTADLISQLDGNVVPFGVEESVVESSR